ncbi:MAG: DUF4058 family protein [Pirellulaceae bacterium]|nr:DUF4058 family protein [Pirellulaceae bacterium]
MPSPFPGMDPYLEKPASWPNLHLLLIASANALLKPLLRPRGYLVCIGERVWVTEPGRPHYPDVAVVERPRLSPPPVAGVSTLEADAPVLVRSFEVELHEPYLEIIDAAGGQLVTGIEFLSPANKAPGEGQDLYLKKQRETLGSGANLVEVDLLRHGRHTVAVPAHLLSGLPDWDYLISIARAGHRGEYETYPVPLQRPLPRIAIPLKGGEPDVVLDLQAVLARAYDEGPFADRIDYTQAPDARMSAEQVAWCRQVVEQAGINRNGNSPA